MDVKSSAGRVYHRRLMSSCQFGTKINKNRRHRIHNSIKKQKINVDSINIVHNLSDLKLSLVQTYVLNRGLQYGLSTNHKLNNQLINTYSKEIAVFTRSLQIRKLFQYKDNSGPTVKFTGNPNWLPANSLRSPLLDGLGLYLNKKLKNLINKQKSISNISNFESKALDDLRYNKTILISKADKGGKIVIMNATDYVSKVDTMLLDLNTYTPVPVIDLDRATSDIDHVLSTLFRSNCINRSQIKFLKTLTPKLPVLYGLPKIHKQNWPLRPIVSQIDSPAYKLNKYLDYLLTTAEKGIPNLLQDTTSFLNVLHKLPKTSPNTILFTIDVTSLYTVLPHAMIKKYVVDQYTETLCNWSTYTPDILPIPPLLLEKILDIILSQSFFSFNEKSYTQNYGITMGAPSSVKIANITLYKHLLLTLISYKESQPQLNLRYIDDIFGMFDGELVEFLKWVDFLNAAHETIKFTSEHSFTQIPFLDTMVYVEDFSIKTTLYKKPTDNRQYLLFTSAHPFHTKKAIPYSQALRYRRLISDDDNFRVELDKLRSNFLVRKYPLSIINKAFDRVKVKDRLDALQYRDKSLVKWKAIPLLLTFDNRLVNDKKVNIYKILDVAWKTLTDSHSDLDYLPLPKIVFKKCNSISYFLESSTYPPKRWLKQHKFVKSIDRSETDNHRYKQINNRLDTVNTLHNYIDIEHLPFKSNPCNKNNCLMCPYMVQTSTVTSTIFNKSFHIKQNLTCATTNLIYLITCKKCNIQYIGETKRTLRDRFNNHKSTIIKNINTPVGLHFNSLGHSLRHLSITPLEGLINTDGYLRRSREAYWQLELGTLFPLGLNQFPVKDAELFKSFNIENHLDIQNAWSLIVLTSDIVQS